ncbi:TIGR01777 family oxidoreductase [Ichthyenterobacterium sp. W332]|uniref:TIGR01777 family oxidoreductase n=1 Tax=Microcosmobacter mediterraneus TaxID=3075607 RepID=A0ABU2YGI7_9FLAO|nr:TIGR01777 family oxidoreductase [Ichthyenterobacterium sp. W332]MDT0557288.1 TIGR01777 family oxidoreductase [Ichthyenterobacterium sp. W332]
MKVLITGATGLVGSEIVNVCHVKGIDVHYLTTSKHKISNKPNYKGFYWNPSVYEIDIACFEGVDAVVNLAGASISKRWTKSYKQEVLDSRLQSLELLYDSVSKNGIKIKQFISASAIGIYPDSDINYYEEDYKEYSFTFLGKVVTHWEKAVDAFKELNFNVAKIRIGLVLSAKGGALTEIIKPMKFGLGAAFGDGKQWQSWIHVKDLAELFVHCIEQNLSGIYNGVAPNPVSNNELTKAAAKALGKPLFLPNIPKAIMALTLGEMHILLFESQRVSAQKIESTGFDFQFPNLQLALEDIL